MFGLGVVREFSGNAYPHIRITRDFTDHGLVVGTLFGILHCKDLYMMERPRFLRIKRRLRLPETPDVPILFDNRFSSFGHDLPGGNETCVTPTVAQ